MKLKDNFFYTIKEEIKDEDSLSGKLLVKSGMIKKSSNGIYMYMPLGLKVFKNIEKIVREEMNNASALELCMPNLLPEDVYIKSGRRDNFGNDMFNLKDRYNRNYVLGPTHEELFVEAAKMKIQSYKDMPFNIYQIGLKYRDEPRPRYGLIRVREFTMKDAYSFDINDSECDKSYQKMKQAYNNIFNRLKLNYRTVIADTGTMGGKLSEEFQALSNIGEDQLVICDNCGYSSNIEVSECLNKEEIKEELKEKELIYTPNIKTIEDLEKSLNISKENTVKTLIYKVDDDFVACLLEGNRELNELKLKKLLNAKEVSLAGEEDVERITNSKVGFAGPINLNIPIVIDNDVLMMKNFLVGANKTDYHYKNVNIKDFNYKIKGDIKNVLENDLCIKCHHKLKISKGIEIGNLFKLGTKYSESLNLKYLDENNELKPVVMGSYGIGIDRLMAAIVEQFNDENGIIWPVEVAPFKVNIVLIDPKDKNQTEIALKLYEELNKNNIDVLLDDRNLRPGVKFMDCDLIGIPIRIVVGKKINEGLVEVKLRNSKEITNIQINDFTNEVEELLNKIN